MNISEVLTGITSGQFDHELSRIKDALLQRQNYLDTQNFFALSEGDKFLISNRVKPKLLADAVVQVVGFTNDGKVIVTLLDTVNAKWRAGKEVVLAKALIGPRV